MTVTRHVFPQKMPNVTTSHLRPAAGSSPVKSAGLYHVNPRNRIDLFGSTMTRNWRDMFQMHTNPLRTIDLFGPTTTQTWRDKLYARYTQFRAQLVKYRVISKVVTLIDDARCVSVVLLVLAATVSFSHRGISFKAGAPKVSQQFEDEGKANLDMRFHGMVILANLAVGVTFLLGCLGYASPLGVSWPFVGRMVGSSLILTSIALAGRFSRFRTGLIVVSNLVGWRILFEAGDAPGGRRWCILLILAVIFGFVALRTTRDSLQEASSFIRFRLLTTLDLLYFCGFCYFFLYTMAPSMEPFFGIYADLIVTGCVGHLLLKREDVLASAIDGRVEESV